MTLMLLRFALLSCVPTLGYSTTHITQSILQHEQHDSRRLRVSSVPMAALNETTMFQEGEWKSVWNPYMSGLTRKCKRTVQAEAQKQEGMNAPKQSKRFCDRPPCNGRVEGTHQTGTDKHVLVEGPMCLPKDCQNKADIEVIKTNMHGKIQDAFQDSAKVTLEINCHQTGSYEARAADKEKSSSESAPLDQIKETLPAVDNAQMPVPQQESAAPLSCAPTLAVFLIGLINFM